VSKQTTEKVQGGNPCLSLYENQKKNLVPQPAGLLYKRAIIIDQNGLFS
jgi:hypothetical protein